MPSSDTQFKPGQSGNPGGKPVGTRNRISTAFLLALANDFETHGADVVAEVRENKPDVYLNVVGKLMPKLMELSGPDGGEIPLSGVVRFDGKRG